VLRNRFPGPSTPLHVSSVLGPVRAEDGRLLGVVGISRDVTSELAIRQLREELVAIITHDLRSPIAAILLSAEQALRRPAGPDGVTVPSEELHRITRSAQRLGHMASELLDASRVELAALPLERATVDLPAFLFQLVSDLTPSLRGHPIETDLPPHPVEVRIDRLRLAQVVTNLLDNASKYSRDGSTIHFALHDEGATLHISVADEGEGIDAADVPRLFDRFYQSKKARQKKGGLGLGLYITKGIVDAHGGTLTVDTARGVGSTFHVRLPRE
jgi:signal transduction histidine kinase